MSPIGTQRTIQPRQSFSAIGPKSTKAHFRLPGNRCRVAEATNRPGDSHERSKTRDGRTALSRLFTGTTGRVYMLLCLMLFIEYVDRVNLSVAAPLIKTELSLSNTQLGFALSAFGYCYAFFQIINGYMGDRFDRGLP